MVHANTSSATTAVSFVTDELRQQLADAFRNSSRARGYSPGLNACLDLADTALGVIEQQSTAKDAEIKRLVHELMRCRSDFRLVNESGLWPLHPFDLAMAALDKIAAEYGFVDK